MSKLYDLTIDAIREVEANGFLNNKHEWLDEIVPIIDLISYGDSYGTRLRKDDTVTEIRLSQVSGLWITAQFKPFSNLSIPIKPIEKEIIVPWTIIGSDDPFKAAHKEHLSQKIQDNNRVLEDHMRTVARLNSEIAKLAGQIESDKSFLKSL